MSKASFNLATHQEQLDADGIMVGVSRQAVDETLAEYEALREALTLARKRIEYLAGYTNARHVKTNDEHFFPIIDAALGDQQSQQGSQ